MVNERDTPLNLEMTVASTACTEFLMLRKNSSRGDFQVPISRPEILSGGGSPTLVVNTTSVSGERSSPRYDFLHRSTSSRDTSSLSPTSPSPSNVIDLGALIGEYSVERLHRYKPRWSARFALHSLGFELCRCQLEPRRTVGLFSSNNSKYLKVFWEHVGAADIADHSTTKRVVRITWLPIARPLQRRVQRAESTGFNAMKSGSMSSGTGSVGSYRSESFNHRDGLQIYEGSKWKMLQLEATVDDAWDIAQKINDILERRSSQVRSLYLHSSGGKKKPAVAAEAIAAVDDDTKKYTTLPRERHLTGARKITRIASTFANAVPTLQRKLSRQQN